LASILIPQLLVAKECALPELVPHVAMQVLDSVIVHVLSPSRPATASTAASLAPHLVAAGISHVPRALLVAAVMQVCPPHPAPTC
jgi:hypothetical protein